MDQEGLSYLHSEVPAVHIRWAQYQQRMNALRLNKEECELVVQAAKEFFAYVETLFQVLYPFKPESRVFHVTEINPDAGQHPVPADAREVEASLQAADICWEKFPYLKQRYGERGLRFTRSDSAWLATLVACEPAQIIAQVRWLGRVLAGRGMPTLVLQAHLEKLVEVLSSAIPERKSHYEKLLLASGHLQEARCRYLAQDKLQVLSEAFDRAVGREWFEKLPHTGYLLASAVADEMAGCEGAVENLCKWMADPARFPSVWMNAVEATLAQARQHACPSKNAPSEPA